MLDIVIAVLLGIFTLVTAYLGVHVTIHPAETEKGKWRYKSAFILCGTAACTLIGIQTYRNNDAQAAVRSQINRIDRNTIKVGYVSIGSIVPVDGSQKLVAGKTVALNVFFENKSEVRVEKIKNLESLVVASESEENGVRKQFANYLQESIRHDISPGAILSPGDQQFWNTAESPVLTHEQAILIGSGVQRLYLNVFVSWVDLQGKTGKEQQCWWIKLPAQTTEITPSAVVLHSCNGV